MEETVELNTTNMAVNTSDTLFLGSDTNHNFSGEQRAL